MNEPTQAEKKAAMDLMQKHGEEVNKAAAAAFQRMQKPSPEQIRANEENSRRPPLY